MVKRPHVLLIVENNSVPKDFRVWNEANALKEMGYEVSVICPKENNGETGKKSNENFLIIDGINIYRHPYPVEAHNKSAFIAEYLNSILWQFAYAVKIYLKKPFKVIHGANPPDLIFLVALLFKIFGVKYIFDHHDIAPETYVAKFKKEGVYLKLLRIFEWFSFKSAKIVISTNESYKKIAIERGNKKEEDVFVVRNGVDLNTIKLFPPNEKFRQGFKSLVGYVGCIGQQEEIGNLVNMVNYLVNTKKITDIRFIVVGTGTNWSEVVNMTKEMGLDRYIWFTGYIPDEDLWEILSTVDVCINPEFGNEFTDKSTMIKIMEYMAFSKPIVQYFTTEGQVTAGKSSIYIKENSIQLFADKLIELLNDQEKMKEMGKIGRIRIENELGWHIQKKELAKAYSAILK